MEVLIKNALVVDQNSLFNGQKKDVLILDGIIKAIESNITGFADSVIMIDDIVISKGWVDLFAHFNEPGNEHRETIKKGIKAKI